MPLYALQRCPRVWGADAEGFQPDRWLPGGSAGAAAGGEAGEADELVRAAGAQSVRGRGLRTPALPGRMRVRTLSSKAWGWGKAPRPSRRAVSPWCASRGAVDTPERLDPTGSPGHVTRDWARAWP